VTDFAVQLTRPAIRDIQKLPGVVHSKIIESLLSLQQNPFPQPPLKKRLKGFGFPVYRLRVADFRLLYRIDEKTITIMRVLDRKELEAALSRPRPQPATFDCFRRDGK
jgi:mRNA-degrading endonuclease RelE of RelBE toxin-antitoxin system